MAKAIDKGGHRFEGLNKPIMTPRHPKYAAAVVASVDGKQKLIRFGLHGESKADAEKRSNWKKRHSQNIKRGPISGAYWANKFLW